MRKIIGFGETVKNYNVPVLNEREIRAAAGILFLMMIISILLAALSENFTLVKYAITIFMIDIAIRVFINPKYSPTLIIGRIIVKNQVPEYVGAAQKKFAWIIGTVLAVIMFVLLVIFNIHSPITGIICLICWVFLFFETAFGICLGCMFYPLFFKEKAQYCAGEVCEIKEKHEIQKVSLNQITIVISFLVLIFVLAYFFNNFFAIKPSMLWIK